MGTKNTPRSIPKIKNTARAPHPFYRRKVFLWPVGVTLGLIIAVVLAFQLSPWPGIVLVRTVFDRGSRQTLAAMQKHTPGTPITVLLDQQYKQGNKRALLDVYIPTSAEQQANSTLPAVVWTHGGGWVSGDKADDGPYFKLLAAQGFTVISVNYTLAPEKVYPAQLHELNEAHAYIAANAARFHLNPNDIFLAGDSAGSQLSSQMAALITNPSYAKEVGIQPALKPTQLAGTVLFCGIYKVEGLTEAAPNLPKILSWGDDQVAWAYSGTRNKSGPLIHQMSAYYHVTKDFPPTFISGGNGDPLTAHQSIPLADKLKSLEVPTTTLFYAANHTPSLPHEYQFNLDTADGSQALTYMVDFLRATEQ
ncbi:MAG TPA: alpha/beta hydrolase [Bacillota bacterium]|nr:alpha/beta hydrolase [Bacillota bacterium]